MTAAIEEYESSSCRNCYKRIIRGEDGRWRSLTPGVGFIGKAHCYFDATTGKSIDHAPEDWRK